MPISLNRLGPLTPPQLQTPKPQQQESLQNEKMSKLSLGESLKKGWGDFKAKIPNPFKASEAVGMSAPKQETSWRIVRYIKSFSRSYRVTICKSSCT